MFQLSPDAYHKAQALFDTLAQSQMYCVGVLKGIYDGQVFVDDPDAPTAGFVTKDGMWWFLAGDPTHTQFNTALNAAIFDRERIGKTGWGLMVCHPPEWDVPIADSIFAPHIPNKTNRLHYLAREMNFDWQALVPAEITIRFVDETLLADGIDLPHSVQNVINLRQETTAAPDSKAIGYVALHDKHIVAYAVIDCIVEGGGDIGLFTNPDFRRRGLAAITSAAVMEYGLNNGLHTVHWDCEGYNHGSIATAEKLGLVLDHEHANYVLILNPEMHEANRAWSLLDAGQNDAAAAIAQTAIGDDNDAHYHFYYVLARTHADAGRGEDALQILEQAAQQGWDSVEEATSDFAAFADHPKWDSIMGSIAKNAE